jgi:hypothetical protein
MWIEDVEPKEPPEFIIPVPRHGLVQAPASTSLRGHSRSQGDDGKDSVERRQRRRRQREEGKDKEGEGQKRQRSEKQEQMRAGNESKKEGEVKGETKEQEKGGVQVEEDKAAAQNTSDDDISVRSGADDTTSCLSYSRSASTPGLFPRPLDSKHPRLPEVCRRFRLLGRLAATAVRDQFVLPVPLSTSFLKLVQGIRLESVDLPRPGFTGGEIAAIEMNVVAKLDKLDLRFGQQQSGQPLFASAVDGAVDGTKMTASAYATALAEILDAEFTKSALHMSYECTFRDFLDADERCFVDPLDGGTGGAVSELRPQGALQRVTIHNVREYVCLVKERWLDKGVCAQVNAFRQGVRDFFPAEWFLPFSPMELRAEVCGEEFSWTESALRKYVIPSNTGNSGQKFTAESSTYKYLLQELLTATTAQRKAFLTFITSIPVKNRGHIEVVPVVKTHEAGHVGAPNEIAKFHDPQYMPRARTCSSTLYLPRFESRKQLHDVLWNIVDAELKHKGFFEWSSGAAREED